MGLSCVFFYRGEADCVNPAVSSREFPPIDSQRLRSRIRRRDRRVRYVSCELNDNHVDRVLRIATRAVSTLPPSVTTPRKIVIRRGYVARDLLLSK